MLCLEGERTGDTLLDGCGENVSPVGHVTDGGVFARVKGKVTAHVKADLQNGQRQIFVVHDGFDQICVLSAEDVVPVKTDVNI